MEDDDAVTQMQAIHHQDLVDALVRDCLRLQHDHPELSIWEIADHYPHLRLRAKEIADALQPR